MEKPLVSVIITTYERGSELKRALISVISQTYQNIEIIIVDDNTKDTYSQTIKNIIKDCGDQRIKYIKNPKNLGGAMSRNAGIKNARGEFIAFLDDDDEYLPEKIEKQLALFDKTSDKTALIYGYCQCVRNGKTIDVYKNDCVGNCIFDGMRTCIAATSQWMCRKKYLEAVGNFSDVPCKQDSTVILKLLLAGYELDRVPEVLSIYHDDHIPRISNKKASERIVGEEKLLNLCRENYDKITKLQEKEVEYYFACSLARYYRITGDKNKYKKAIRTILKTHPLSIKTFRTITHLFDK